MIEIFEIKDKDKIQDAAEKFGLKIPEVSRVFLMRETIDIGLGVLGLDDETIILKHICAPEKPHEYYDLLVRSMLNSLRDLKGFKVVLNHYDSYFLRFGFERISDGKMQIISDKIDLKGACKNA